MREIFLKSVLSIGCGRGTPEEGGIGPGVDVVVDAVEFLWGGMWTRDAREWRHQSGGGCSWGCFRSFWGMERGAPEEGGIGPGVDAVVDAVEVL